jgi:hypothetical protein
VPNRIRGHLRPKLAKPVNSEFRRIARDNRSVDRSNRNTGNPIRMDVGFGQRLVDASLICPQSAAALQEQHCAIEWQTPVGGREVWSRLKVHGSRALGLRLPKPAICPDGDRSGLSPI